MMKAIVIENEFELDEKVSSFLAANSNLFETVDIQLVCLHRPLEDVARFIIQADAVIVKSTWYYKLQLEKFVDAFATNKFQKDYTFFIYEAEYGFNSFLEDTSGFIDFDNFKTSLINLVNTRKVFSFNDEGKYKLVTYNNQKFE